VEPGSSTASRWCATRRPARRSTTRRANGCCGATSRERLRGGPDLSRRRPRRPGGPARAAPHLRPTEIDFMSPCSTTCSRRPGAACSPERCTTRQGGPPLPDLSESDANGPERRHHRLRCPVPLVGRAGTRARAPIPGRCARRRRRHRGRGVHRPLDRSLTPRGGPDAASRGRGERGRRLRRLGAQRRVVLGAVRRV